MGARRQRRRIGRELAWLRLQDFLNGLRLGHFRLHRRLLGHLREQRKHWKGSYVQGYFYQGLEELGIAGAKPTGYRFTQYDVDEILKDADVLDIGSNTGFVSVYCAKLARSVTGVELNPYLNRMARETAQYLGLTNVDFVESDFRDYRTDRKFDVVLSLSNHHTIDGNLDLGFEQHMSRIADLLRPGGVMLFESHNVFGPGVGGVGDDGDMDAKVSVMSRYFRIERYRMVRKFLKHSDIDKLFIVARRSEAPTGIDFDLKRARTRYDWTSCPETAARA